jgi:FAD:protein FMN transferase
MGCDVVVGGGDPDARVAIGELFAERDQIFSRFRAGSELNRVNELGGRWAHVSEAFASMLALALAAANDTEGLVDPTLGGAMEAAGYDDDFSRLHDDGPSPTSAPRGTWRSVRLVGRHLFVPTAVRLDLNGVVKGKTVDDALALLPGDGFVCAGGDIAVRGGAVVALPAEGTVRLVRGSLATSGSDRRRWLRGGTIQHHLIDPRTGSPSRSCWRQVTACGANCVAADVAAKAGFLLSDAGPGWLEARGIPARFVATDSTVSVNERWSESMARDLACT